jgi:mutator protein MutT
MNDKNRKNTRVAVYLIGTRGDTVLLGKRQNTGHMDGCWSLIAGHVDEGESSTRAMIRELQEECGVRIEPNELSLIGSMHHKSPPYDYINYIFHVDLMNHEPQNVEQHKCESLAFHSVTSLPTPMEQYVMDIIQKSVPQKGLWICEYGWDE